MSPASCFIDAPSICNVGCFDFAGHGQKSILTFERVHSQIVPIEVLYFSMLGNIVPRPPPVSEVYRLWCTILCTPYSLFSRPTCPRRATKINIIRHWPLFCHLQIIAVKERHRTIRSIALACSTFPFDSKIRIIVFTMVLKQAQPWWVAALVEHDLDGDEAFGREER